MVIYESPYRVCALLQDIEVALGDRNIFIARELTKKFEQAEWKTVKDWQIFYKDRNPKGEFYYSHRE